MSTNSDELMAEKSDIDTSRRGFFRAATRGVSQTFETPDAPAINMGRPLGAVEESLFDRLCNQCGECAAVCPQGVINLSSRGPELDLSLNHCTFCQKCIHACDTQALNSLNTIDTGLRPKFTNSCNARLFGNCEECYEDCPRSAIELQPNQLPTLNDNCNGCGECVSSCYIGAISLCASH